MAANHWSEITGAFFRRCVSTSSRSAGTLPRLPGFQKVHSAGIAARFHLPGRNPDPEVLGTHSGSAMPARIAFRRTYPVWCRTSPLPWPSATSGGLDRGRSGHAYQAVLQAPLFLPGDRWGGSGGRQCRSPAPLCGTTVPFLYHRPQGRIDHAPQHLAAPGSCSISREGSTALSSSPTPSKMDPSQRVHLPVHHGSWWSAERSIVVPKLHHRSKYKFRRALPELLPGERLRYTDNFDDPELPGEIVVTVTLKAVQCGTELQIVQRICPT